MRGGRSGDGNRERIALFCPRPSLNHKRVNKTPVGKTMAFTDRRGKVKQLEKISAGGDFPEKGLFDLDFYILELRTLCHSENQLDISCSRVPGVGFFRK